MKAELAIVSKHVRTPPRIVVVGSINIDLVARCERLPRAGETVHAEDLRQVPGGKGANQAVAAARLGASSHLIGRVGSDAFGQTLKETLTGYDVHTEAVMVTDGASSGVAMIGVEASGENAITIVAGANWRLSPEDIERHRELIQSADALIVQLEVPLDTVGAALSLAKACSVWTVLDPAPAPIDALPSEFYGVDVMTPNETEAENLTGIAVESIEDAVQAGLVLQERGVRLPVITLGGRGAVLIDDLGSPSYATAPRVNTVDTTAAGDAFTAAFSCRLAEGADPATAIRFASHAGSLATTVRGAQNSMPEFSEVIKLVSQ